MTRLRYEEGGPELFRRVAPLWERLRSHHQGISVNFQDHFAQMNFPDRKKELLGKSRRGNLRIFLAHDLAAKQDTGYAVATIDKLMTGELDSLYVDDTYRGKKIGEALTKRALAWIRKQKPVQTVIYAAVGNERVLDFYRKFEFHPYIIQLREKA